MKTSRWLAGLVLLPSALALADQTPIPQPLPADRYNKLLEDSPFAVATAPAPVEKPEEPWAANLFLGIAGQVPTPTGQKEDFVVIRRKGDMSGDFSLTPSEEGPDGIRLVRIEWAEDPLLTKAVLKKGDKEATVPRNEADFTQSSAPAAPQPRSGQPGAAANPGANNLTLGGAGQRKLPAPAGAQAIPRPSILPTATANANAPAPQPNNNRQRIRVIEPGPRAR